jgi:hypothetical protein
MNILSALLTRGYAEIFGVWSAEEAMRATDMLGDVVPLNGQAVQRLTPKNSDESVLKSFSKRHGRGFFPLHTDTAFWVLPARFIVLFAADESTTSTRVLPLQDTRDLISIARRSNPVFMRQTDRGMIYSHPWIDMSGCCALYDPCYMRPVNRAAEDFEKATLEFFMRSQQFAWERGRVLVIDNWRVLHGRDECGDSGRVIYRFYRGVRG